ncbi:DUF397 domain-containing protein [Actinomadura sp. SCN-SB]|uniref:DUF397 domain-containing protein n=1 Tax=Actinomadura sp. SCN-SB TaxID=3373092 RepID=UPI003752CC88
MRSDTILWRKASRSHEDGDQCVEVASLANVVAVRDSKDPNGSILILSRRDFARLASALKNV